MNLEIKDLLSYYSPASGPNPVIARKVAAVLGRVPDAELKKVADWIIDHVPKKAGIDVPAVRQAMRECGVVTPEAPENPKDWECDLCGTKFQWAQVSSSALRKQGIHDFCPRCGLPPIETITAGQYAELKGARPEWYKNLRKSYKDAMELPGWKPRYNPREDEEFEAEQKRRKVERLKKEFQEDAEDVVSKLAGAKKVTV